MQQVIGPEAAPRPSSVSALLPLYGASMLLTLAGVGAVGSTMGTPSWTTIWSGLTVVGHVISLVLRQRRIQPELAFYPVMVVGIFAVLQQFVTGGPMLGMETGLSAMDHTTATGLLVSSLAVIRSFTLLTNASLLFSPVPAITMLALSGSSNPNTEILIFFGVLILGSLFITGYETSLRRSERTGRPIRSVLAHLLLAWTATLAVSALAALFPLVVQPVVAPFSPFALSRVPMLRGMLNFTQASASQTPVGQGPITLSRNPVYEVHSREGGLLRASVFSNYTGRSWTLENPPAVAEIYTRGPVERPDPDSASGIATRIMYAFSLPPDPDQTMPVPSHVVQQNIVTRGYTSQGVPGLGRITDVYYPRPNISIHSSGAVLGGGHSTPGKGFSVLSTVFEFPAEALRKTAFVNREQFNDRETLSIPQSAYRVKQLAERLTHGIANPYDRVQALMKHIEKTCAYTLQEAQTPPDEDAASYYLLTTKRGACDLAASGLAVMCRSVGIPARVAVGYVADEPLPEGGGFLIRQEHAHMWVEAYFQGYGWVPFNPAPNIASIHDSPYQALMYRLQNLLSRIGGGGMDAVLLVVIVLATAALLSYTAFIRVRLIYRRWMTEHQTYQSSPAAATAVLYARAMRRLARRGWARPVSATPREFLEDMRRQWMGNPQAVEALTRLTDLFERAHYAGECSPADRDAAAQALASLARTVPRRPRRRVRPARPAGETA